MKIDWQVAFICLGLFIVISIPILVYIPSGYIGIMGFALGMVLTISFYRWGLKNE